MRENKYDDAVFFEKYSGMERSQKGLEAAGEWHELEKMLPCFEGKRVLDLGCGFGWHCRYAAEHGARSVLGIDISEKMLHEAARKTRSDAVRYIRMPIEEIDFPEGTFDVVLSSLAFHYIESFRDICEKIAKCLVAGGDFVFSVEHPIFTAHGTQEWHCDGDGHRIHWPVDRYFTEGLRDAVFLGEHIAKYHRTLTTYIDELLAARFEIIRLVEPQPDERLLCRIPDMRDELRRPMLLILSTRKK